MLAHQPIITRQVIAKQSAEGAIARKLDPSAVSKQIKRSVGAATKGSARPDLLCATQRGIVWHWSVKPRQPQQAGHHSSGLSQGQREQHFDRKTKLEGGIGEDRHAPRSPFMWREPSHFLVQPDEKLPALAQRRVVAGPVRSAVAGGERLARATRVTAWSHIVNCPQSELCNNAG